MEKPFRGAAGNGGITVSVTGHHLRPAGAAVFMGYDRRGICGETLSAPFSFAESRKNIPRNRVKIFLCCGLDKKD